MITIGEYIGFLFKEITRARQYADAESVRIARLYAQDEVLQHFSVPRFKIPQMELSIPILVTDAKYQNIYRLKAVLESFEKTYLKELSILTKKKEMVIEFSREMKAELQRVFKFIDNEVATADLMSYEELLRSIKQEIEKGTETILKPFQTARLRLDQADILELNTNVFKYISHNLTIEKTTLSSVLINPETEMLKAGANQDILFRINAKIVEDGVFITKVQNANGKDITNVNFE